MKIQVILDGLRYIVNYAFVYLDLCFIDSSFILGVDASLCKRVAMAFYLGLGGYIAESCL